MKGAADAPCNPEAGVPRRVPGHASQRARFRGDPSNDSSKGLGPPSPARLQDERAEGGPEERNLGGCVLKRPFAGFDIVENPSHRWQGRGDVGGAQQEGNVEIPGLAMPDSPWGSQTSAGRRPPAEPGGKLSSPWSSLEPVPPVSGRRGGSRNPASSNSGETEVNPETAEQTMLRIALWRRTLSPPPQHQREWSPHRSRTSPHMPHAESRSQSFNFEDVCALVL